MATKSAPAGEFSELSGRSGRILAELLREALDNFAGRAFEFSEPVQEDKDWDICARRGQERFRIQISFMESMATGTAGEWVITILPEFNWNPFKHRDRDTRTEAVNLLRAVIGKVLKGCEVARRQDLRSCPMVVVAESGGPAYGR